MQRNLMLRKFLNAKNSHNKITLDTKAIPKKL